MAYPAVPRNAKGYDIENAINRILRFLNPGLEASNAGKVLTSNSTGTDLEWDAIPHNLLQMVSFETGAVATGTTLIPIDDTIPQNTEGDQYMSLAITPKSASSKLVIEILVVGSNSVTNALIVGIFQDSAAGALKAAWAAAGAGAATQVMLRCVVSSGSTNATTFKVRAGGSSAAAGTFTFNGVAGARFLGGVMASGIVIREYAA